MWEEPCISGKNGSGTIFFCGCNLRCIFCQNHDISTAPSYRDAIPVDAHRLCELMLSLQDTDAHNINLVTPTPHIHVIAQAVALAKLSGLRIPVVFNTNSYVNADALEKLDGLVDIYLPDLKYVTPALAKLVSAAENYPSAALSAIKEMYRQTGTLTLDTDGMAQSGVLIRHLVLPGNIDETRRVLAAISENFTTDMHISLMSQYFPSHRAEQMPPFDRRLLPREYKRAVDYALSLGFEHVYTQMLDSAQSAYVPQWGVF